MHQIKNIKRDHFNSQDEIKGKKVNLSQIASVNSEYKVDMIKPKNLCI